MKMESTIGTQASTSGKSSKDAVSFARMRKPATRTHVNKLDRDFWFPPSVVPADEVDVAIQEENIARHQPLFETFHSGVLYATGSRTPVVVRVSLKLHVSAFRDLSDLETSYWVNQRDPHGRISFPSNFIHSVHSTSDGRLSSSFTIFLVK
ncbi:hypothetical protein AZE42_06172 [Rhizopogon vesiculosus]|uniref:Uncharacterized protein n=1 Tax=Rhizopogon vesiculosus TaxID=180088 RepID=A0A1J8Q2N4_9AGAM|nr:hypothetical protein AZE42_06172 [Rhizopogon vesiculosus]